MRIDEKNNRGEHVDTCRTTAQASFDGGNIVVTEHGGPECTEEGRGYYPSVVTCRPDGFDMAECNIVQDLGDEKTNRTNSEFNRVGTGS